MRTCTSDGGAVRAAGVAIALVCALTVVGCHNGGQTSISPTPVDTSTPTQGVTVAIGPCTTSLNCPGFDPSIFINVDSRGSGPCETPFACRAAPCPSCSWSYTFLNQNVSGAGQKETQFQFHENQQGNYEVAIQMPAGDSAFLVVLNSRFSPGSLGVRSVTLIDAPNWRAGCNGSDFSRVQMTFWKEAGTPVRTARFLINARAVVDQPPRCEM
jgi:hypothetical protein